jgi:hypothetical protein
MGRCGIGGFEFGRGHHKVNLWTFDKDGNQAVFHQCVNQAPSDVLDGGNPMPGQAGDQCNSQQVDSYNALLALTKMYPNLCLE